jgi:hypothetical protein
MKNQETAMLLWNWTLNYEFGVFTVANTFILTQVYGIPFCYEQGNKESHRVYIFKFSMDSMGLLIFSVRGENSKHGLGNTQHPTVRLDDPK